MKVLVVALVAVLATVNADADNDIRLARLFIGCCQKAIIGGIPSIPIPDHNPLVIRNFTYSGSALLTKYNISVTNNILNNLVNFTFPNITAVDYSDPERVAYNYDLYWPILNFTGNFEVDIKAPLVDQSLVGTYNIIMREIHWTGLFNLTKPGQENVTMNLDDFTLNSATESVSVDIEGINSVTAAVVETTLTDGLWLLMNNFPAAAGEFLRTERFNGFWISHPDRLLAIIDNCNKTELYF
ncbi:uncharacterized protein LOC126743251 [Anthonomus grandis grandis]|uniref:uncharacterized protein LOC126743251 n=1 Tax=Anthonomus grandis grandis TaxID=2921223 RepID=UPI0021659F6D|nr:uncharacterized protein LOC126743251 [Anthonomus grandis grandis]